MDKIKHILLLIGIFIFVSLFNTSIVYAAYECEACNTTHDVTGIEGIALTFADATTNINFFKDSPSDGFSLTALLEFDVKGNQTFKNLWEGNGKDMVSVKTTVDAVMPVGLVLALVYFALDLSQKVFHHQFNLEQFFASLMRLALATFIMLNAFEILTLVSQLSTVIFREIKASPQPKDGNTCLLDFVKDMGIFEQVGYILSMLLSYLIILISWLIILVTAWKRIFNIVVYALFFPIGIADIVKDGVDSTGFGYIKKIFAKFLQASIALAIIKAYNIIATILLSSGSMAGAAGTIIISLTVMTLMLQTESMASTLLGV